MSINNYSCFLPHYQDQNTLYSVNKRVASKHVSVMKERQIIEQLQRIVIESDQENKRLQQKIVKMTQKQKNTTLYYQSRISQLQKTTEKQMLKIQSLQAEKLRREQNLNQSKLTKTNIYEPKKYNICEQKQNINTLNSNFQDLHQHEYQYKERQIKKYLNQLSQRVDYLLHTLQIRKRQRKNNEQYMKQLENQRQKKRILAGKDSLLLLKNINQKILVLQKTMENISNQFNLSDPLLLSFKNIKRIQQGLLKIPFLEKINLNQRQQELDDIVQQAKQTKKRIFLSLTSHKIQ